MERFKSKSKALGPFQQIKQKRESQEKTNYFLCVLSPLAGWEAKQQPSSCEYSDLLGVFCLEQLHPLLDGQSFFEALEESESRGQRRNQPKPAAS